MRYFKTEPEPEEMYDEAITQKPSTADAECQDNADDCTNSQSSARRDQVDHFLTQSSLNETNKLNTFRTELP